MPAISDLLPDWDATQANVDAIGATPGPIVDANPRRFGFGVASGAVADGKLQFATTALGSTAGIHIGPNEFHWFDLHKHGTLVNAAWWLIKQAGADFSVTVYEVVQSPNAK